MLQLTSLAPVLLSAIFFKSFSCTIIAAPKLLSTKYTYLNLLVIVVL
jgi:hypothetical protein